MRRPPETFLAPYNEQLTLPFPLCDDQLSLGS